MMREWLTRLRHFLRQSWLKRGGESELDEEIRFHVEHATEAKMAAGMTPVEARRQALIEFGGVERAREQCHEQRPGWWMGTVGQDARYALRGFCAGDRRDDSSFQRCGPDSLPQPALCA
jgi:hypothetical protein